MNRRPISNTDPPTTLMDLALVQFTKLSLAETKAINGAATGVAAYCGPDQLDSSSENQPSDSSNWSADRSIRAEVIDWICSSQTSIVHPKGLKIHAALIITPLDLSYRKVPFRLIFQNCDFRHDVVMQMISIQELSFAGSRLTNLDLSRADIKGTLFLNNNCIVRGVTKLINAHVAEDLNCTTGKFMGMRGETVDGSYALQCPSISISADLIMEKSYLHTGGNLSNARIGGDFNAAGASFNSVSVWNSSDEVNALNCDSIDVRRDIKLGDHLQSKGTLFFNSMMCGGSIDFSGGAKLIPNLSTPEEIRFSFSAENAHIGGDLDFDEDFVSTGPISLLAAHIGGDLELSHAHLTNITTSSYKDTILLLKADDAIVSGNVRMLGAKAVGCLSFSSVEIGSDFICSAASLERSENDGSKHEDIPTLSLQSSLIKGNLFLDDQFKASGLVSLVGTTINGDLFGDNGVFINPFRRDSPSSGTSIAASRSTIKGKVYLWKVVAVGQVTFDDAVIGSDLNCTAASLSRSLEDLDPDMGAALSCVKTQVAGNIFLGSAGGEHPTDLFVSRGPIILDYVRCEGNIYGDGARFLNPRRANEALSGTSFRAFSARVTRGIYFRWGFYAEGEVRISNSQIGEVLSCVGGKFVTSPVLNGSDILSALFTRGTTVAGGIHLDQGCQIEGILNLSDTRTYEYADDRKKWPKQDQLFVDGFIYKRFVNEPKGAERVQWLKLQPREPIPTRSYLQLAGMLAEVGDEAGSKKALIALEDEKTQSSTLPHLEGITRRMLFGRTVGYGYEPINAVWGIACLTCLGWIIYRRSYMAGSMIPTDKDAIKSFYQNRKVPPEYGHFSPLIYSLENTVPLVKLGQVDKWRPLSSRSATLAPPDKRILQRKQPSIELRGHAKLFRPTQLFKLVRRIALPPVVQYFVWFQIIVGWIIATLFVAGFSGLIHGR